MRLTASGQLRVDEWPEAKTFVRHRIHPTLTKLSASDGPSDGAIQQHIWSIVQTPDDGDRTPALSSLRCFISYGIVQVCRQLVAQFGAEHGFSLSDLLPYVLDDDGSAHHPDELDVPYPTLAIQILQSFDPRRASLSTWVSRRVKRHPDLNRFLLQQGVYLVSDWAILNDTRPNQLKRILTEFHARSEAEVKHAMQLLQSYHQIYRRDRLQQVATAEISRGRACMPPTVDQLQRMSEVLTATTALFSSLNPEQMLHDLRELATLLRQYRIYARGGNLPTESLDQPASAAVAMGRSDADMAADDEDFLSQFRQQFVDSLDKAIAQVLDDRLNLLRHRKKGDPEGFLKALHLFHCEGMAMADIAAVLNLNAQYQVTRLLKLKDFRADVRQRLLVHLGDRLRTLAAPFTDPEQLRRADAKIDAALSDRIDALMSTAEVETNTARNRPLTNLLAQRLCRHLQTRSGES